MIYLDNGATTFPKPQSVIRKSNEALRYFGANPGRGGHKMAIKASELIYNTRVKVAEFFNIPNPSNVVFTLNCTASLNIVIKGLCKSGDHIIISSLEHNAVLRPVEKLRNIGVSYSVAEVSETDDNETLSNFRDCIRENTRLAVFTCASNVFGTRVPFERVSALCHQYGIRTCVDAAQGAGIIPIDLSDSSVDYLCAAGHKGLYGPMGTGILIVNCDEIPDSLIEGGTGSNSDNYSQPDFLPDRFESGTLNFAGFVGLGGGLDFVRNMGIANIYNREMREIQRIYNSLSNMNKVVLYTDYPEIKHFTPVISFNIRNINCEEIAEVLSSRYNIAVRAGLHCAPLAHKNKGTLEIGGTVRAVPSAFTTKNDIDSFIYAVNKL